MVSVEHGDEYNVRANEKALANEIHKLTADKGKQVGDGKESGHQTLGHKSLLKNDELYQYLLETSVYPRESAELRGLRELTAKHPWNIMTTSPDEGQFLNMLMKLMNAKNTMEIGVFTGYSLLSTALALPDDGKIWALDINRKNFQLGCPFFEQAGVAHKIKFCEGPALETLDGLLQDDDKHGFFDFIFIDADKDNYLKYHERVLQLVKMGGLIGYDNTLWNGSLVAAEDEPMPKYVKFYKEYVRELNVVLAADPRIEISHLSISDGITLCRRVR